jgi:hypothetical protein
MCNRGNFRFYLLFLKIWETVKKMPKINTGEKGSGGVWFLRQLTALRRIFIVVWPSSLSLTGIERG